MSKQEARLEKWMVAHGRLRGYVYGHPGFPDGDYCTTSTVLSPPDSIKEGATVETKNTRYTLGKPLGSK